MRRPPSNGRPETEPTARGLRSNSPMISRARACAYARGHGHSSGSRDMFRDAYTGWLEIENEAA
jgi:hypothetical protein